MYDFIVNPRAGKGKSIKAVKLIEEKFKTRNIEYKLHFSKTERHAIELTKNAITNGATKIIAVGGDGTINEVLNGFHSFEKCSLGIIPCGTGNDFIKSVGIPEKINDAIDTLLASEPKFTDFMQVADVRAINIVGTGIDVDVLKRYRKARIIRGKIQYLLSLIVSLFKFKYYPIKAKINNEVKEYKAVIAAVGNGKQFGGNIKMCPLAVADDGLLDVVIIDNVKKSRIPFAFKKLMTGKILEENFCHFTRVKDIEIECGKEYTLNVDGELYDNLPFNVSLVENTLKIIRP